MWLIFIVRFAYFNNSHFIVNIIVSSDRMSTKYPNKLEILKYCYYYYYYYCYC
jgi:hypothetical protein